MPLNQFWHKMKQNLPGSCLSPVGATLARGAALVDFLGGLLLWCINPWVRIESYIHGRISMGKYIHGKISISISIGKSLSRWRMNIRFLSICQLFCCEQHCYSCAMLLTHIFMLQSEGRPDVHLVLGLKKQAPESRSQLPLE